MQQVRFTRPARMLDVYSERVSAGDTAWLCGKRPRVPTARNLKATLYVWCEAAPTSSACSGLNMFVHLTPPSPPQAAGWRDPEPELADITQL